MLKLILHGKVFLFLNKLTSSPIGFCYYTSLSSKYLCVFSETGFKKWTLQLFLIGNGWASVLKTNLSNGITESSPNSKYKYFNVSPRKNVSILSLLWGGTSVTSSNDVYPPDFTFVCFSNAWKICQPCSLYLQFFLQKMCVQLLRVVTIVLNSFSYFVSFVIR